MSRDLADRQFDPAEEEGAESGFTLIELMVVLLIMAILMAIAIPTFLGVRSGAQDRSAQSDLTNAIISAKTIYTNNNGYPTPAGTLTAQLGSSEPELSFTTANVTYGTPHSISVAVAVDGTGIILADQAADQRCWYAEDNENATAVIPGTNGLTPIANGTAAQGISYNGTTVGASGITPCGPADGNWGTRTLVANWGPKYPS